MTTSIIATEIWHRGSEVAVDVRTSACTYRVSFDSGEAHVTAPGLDLVIELDDEVYPAEDFEAAATVLVAQLEGGLEL